MPFPQTDGLHRTAGQPGVPGAKIEPERIEFSGEIQMALSAGEHQLMVIQREGVRSLILAGNDVEAVVVAVGLTIQSQQRRGLLYELPDARPEQPMAKVQHQHHVRPRNLRFDFRADLSLHALRRWFGVNVVDGKELHQLLAFAQRLDEALLNDGGELRVSHDQILHRQYLLAQHRLHPRLRADQAQELHLLRELLDVAEDRQSAPALGFLADETSGDDPVLGGQSLHREIRVAVENRVPNHQHLKVRKRFHRQTKVVEGHVRRQGAAKLRDRFRSSRAGFGRK